MRYLLIILGTLAVWSCSTKEDPAGGLPTVTTTSVSAITSSTASSGGNVTSAGSGNITGRGLVWGTSAGPTLGASPSASASGGTGSFVVQMTALTPGTKYFVRAYATNATGTAYGNEVTFTTAVLVVSAPVVTTTSITNITATEAASGGNVTADGNASITAKGIVWSTSPNPTTASSKTTEAVGTGTGSFTSSITGLSSGTKYYVKAYATNSAGTSYGNELSFTTVSLPTLSTTSLASVLQKCGETFSQKKWNTGGNITSDGNGTITARGIVWGTTSNPTISLTTKTTNGTGVGAFSSTLSNLNYNTTYYVRAYATNVAGTAYGNQISFKALSEVGDAATISSGACIGIIAYVLKSGDPGYSASYPHGLIVSFQDQSANAQWGCYGTSISFAYCSTLYTCADSGTSYIANGCGTAGIAAKLCKSYSIGGWTGWYLPSRDDLVAMSQNKTVVNSALVANGGTALSSSAYYWTCSQWSANTAMTVSFETGAQSETNKNATNRRTRAINYY